MAKESGDKKRKPQPASQPQQNKHKAHGRLIAKAALDNLLENLSTSNAASQHILARAKRESRAVPATKRHKPPELNPDGSLKTGESKEESDEPEAQGAARMSWTAYTGPRGGRGWRSDQTGRVVYQQEKPGESEHEGESQEEAEPEPAQRKGRLEAVRKEILAAAANIKFSDDEISQPSDSSISSTDYDEIEEQMTGPERSRMDEYLDERRRESADESLEFFDADIDLDEVARSLDLSNEDVRAEVNEIITKHTAVEKYREKLLEIVDQWYEKTSRHGTQAIDQIAAELKEHATEPVMSAISDYRDNAEQRIEAERQSQEESYLDSARDEYYYNYDDTDDRHTYLSQFFEENPERFASPEDVEEDVWHKTHDGSYLTFETAGGPRYSISAYEGGNSKVGPVVDIQFADESGSFGITGAGGAHEVFSKVVSSVASYIQHKKPPTITFSAAEKSRRKLYDRLTKVVSRVFPGYSALAVDGDYARLYGVVLRENRDKIIDLLKQKSGREPDVIVMSLRPTIDPLWFPRRFRMSWTSYTGPRGGKGWKSDSTGRVVYQEEKPGEGEHEGESDEPERDTSSEEGVAGPGSAWASKPLNEDAHETFAAYANDDREFTPERQSLHKQIIAKAFKGKTPVDNPVGYILGGGTASGKTSVIKAGLVTIPENTVAVDSDGIKEQLPEYRNMHAAKNPRGAAFTHNESSWVAILVQQQGSQGGYNTLLDGTGNHSIQKLKKRVNILRAAGQQVNAIYVTVDADVAVARSNKRAKVTGRFVPESVIRQTHSGVSRVVPEAIAEGLFDDFSLWDNNGKTPFLVASAKKKNLTIHDEEAWQKFLAKANDA